MAYINNKDLLQSYILTTAKYDFNVYEKRILYRIIELLQYEIEGKKLNINYSINKNLLGDLDIKIPVNYFLKNETDENYSRVKSALISLNKKIITYENDNIWQTFNLIERPKIEKKKTFIEFRLSPFIHAVFLDFSKGYRKYELKTAMQFESVYAMRFYELISGQKKPLCYSIDNLKEILHLSHKYKYVKDFRIKVLDTAKRELDKCSPYTFNYEMNKTGRSFTSVTFLPKYQPQFRDDDLETHELQKQISLSWDLPKDIIDYLIHNFEFTKDGIKNNLDLFKQAHKQFDLIDFLATIKGKVRISKNPQGYIIGAIKRQLD